MLYFAEYLVSDKYCQFVCNVLNRLCFYLLQLIIFTNVLSLCVFSILTKKILHLHCSGN